MASSCGAHEGHFLLKKFQARQLLQQILESTDRVKGSFDVIRKETSFVLRRVEVMSNSYQCNITEN
jgi:hypothetical protein